MSDSGERMGEKKVHDIKLKIEVPKLLSIMTTGKADGYVPGMKDLVNGNPERGILSVSEMMERGNLCPAGAYRLQDGKGDRRH
ncbi:MAG: hypothetical protein MZV63_53540 [Marinilabiliales bacterium]|nr:hypothetical protein [Marinilabiliales bacterium]